MKTIYQELLAAVDDKVRFFRNDLAIDSQTLQEIGKMPFVHIAYTNGTRLVLFRDMNDLPSAGVVVPYLFGTADRVRVVNGALEAVEYCHYQNRDDTWHYYDGRKLQKITADKGLFLAREYRTRMLELFRLQEMRCAA